MPAIDLKSAAPRNTFASQHHTDISLFGNDIALALDAVRYGTSTESDYSELRGALFDLAAQVAGHKVDLERQRARRAQAQVAADVLGGLTVGDVIALAESRDAADHATTIEALLAGGAE